MQSMSSGGSSSRGGADAGPTDGGRFPDASTDGGVETGVRGGLAYAWQVSYDRSYAAHVEVDSKGAAIVSGTIFDAKDIQVGGKPLKSHGAADVMLSRVLPSGAVDWARNYGGTANDYPVSFVLDGSDRIHLVGLYDGEGNIGGPAFPAFAGTPSRYDVYVAGLAANGDHRWSHAITSTEEAFAGPGLALDGADNLLVPGSFLGTTTIAGAPRISHGSWDAYFTRFEEPNGDSTVALPFGGTGDDRATHALFTGKEVILLGRFQGSVAFPTTPPTTLVSAGGTDIFIARVTPSGTMTSVVAFGGTGDEDLAGAKLDDSGDVIIGGTFSSPSLSIFGGPALLSAGGRDLFVASLSRTLGHYWSVRFGGPLDDYLRDFVLAPNGEIALTGEFRDSITFGPDTWKAARAADASTSEIDFLVATLGTLGVPTWSFAAGGPLPDRGLGIAVDAGSNLYVTATFQNPIDFGGGVTLTPDPGQWASALVRFARK
jgi:hypothetical protein